MRFEHHLLLTCCCLFVNCAEFTTTAPYTAHSPAIPDVIKQEVQLIREFSLRCSLLRDSIKAHRRTVVVSERTDFIRNGAYYCCEMNCGSGELVIRINPGKCPFFVDT